MAPSHLRRNVNLALLVDDVDDCCWIMSAPSDQCPPREDTDGHTLSKKIVAGNYTPPAFITDTVKDGGV